MELSGERCRSEEVRGRLEGEVQEVRERVREKSDKLVAAEDALLASRQQVYTPLHHHYITEVLHNNASTEQYTFPPQGIFCYIIQ